MDSGSNSILPIAFTRILFRWILGSSYNFSSLFLIKSKRYCSSLSFLSRFSAERAYSVMILISNSSHQSSKFSTASAPFQCPSLEILRFFLAHLRLPSSIKAIWLGRSPLRISFSSFREYTLYNPDRLNAASFNPVIFYQPHFLLPWQQDILDISVIDKKIIRSLWKFTI